MQNGALDRFDGIHGAVHFLFTGDGLAARGLGIVGDFTHAAGGFPRGFGHALHGAAGFAQTHALHFHALVHIGNQLRKMPHIRGQFGADAVGLVQHRSTLGQLVGQFALMPARGVQLGPQGLRCLAQGPGLACRGFPLLVAGLVHRLQGPVHAFQAVPLRRRASRVAQAVDKRGQSGLLSPGGQPEPQVRRSACGQNRQQYPEQRAFRPRSGQPPRQQKNHGLQQNPHTPTILSKFTLLIDCFENRLSLIFLKWQ